jgi:membrane protease subunit HflC
MNRTRILLLSAILAWIGWDSFYIVDEGTLAIVTRFGEYQVSRLAPGPYVKTPLADTVVRMQRRILVSNTPQAEYLTLDKKKLVADPIARWRILDPIKYYKTLTDESRAKARIDDIVNSELRSEIASHDFGEIIGNRRQPLMDNVAQRARTKVADFGIELVDVQIKRADLPNEVQESVFLRMRAERDRIAKRYRSEGEEEAQKIRAETDKERAILLAKAYEKAQSMFGEGDAQSVAVYANAYGKDADFYALVRSLEAYETSLDPKTHLVLSTNSELLRYMDSPK